MLLLIFTEKQPSASVKPDNQPSLILGSLTVSINLGTSLVKNKAKLNLLALFNAVFHLVN